MAKGGNNKNLTKDDRAAKDAERARQKIDPPVQLIRSTGGKAIMVKRSQVR